MSLEENTDTSHEYCPLQPEQQLSTSDMTIHPSSQDFEDNDRHSATCKNFLRELYVKTVPILM